MGADGTVGVHRAAFVHGAQYILYTESPVWTGAFQNLDDCENLVSAGHSRSLTAARSCGYGISQVRPKMDAR